MRPHEDAGWVAEFEHADDLVRALERLEETRLRNIEIFTPYDVHEAHVKVDALARRPRSIPRVAAAAAIAGAASAYLLQWWISAEAYPLDVGGRPDHAPLAFTPASFEGAVLLAALTTFGWLLARCGLVRLWRPLFDVGGFDRVSRDRFWLLVRERDPHFDETGTADVLKSLGPLRVIRSPMPTREVA